MKNRKDFFKTASASMMLDTQPLPGVPLVEICGLRRVLIESHQGIIAYGSCEILVKVRFGVISVTGEGLQLCKMSREQIVIIGRIGSVNLQRSS